MTRSWPVMLLLCLVAVGCTVPTTTWLPDTCLIEPKGAWFGKWLLEEPTEVANGSAGFEATLSTKGGDCVLTFREPKSPPDKYPKRTNDWEVVRFYKLGDDTLALTKRMDSTFISIYRILVSESNGSLVVEGLDKDMVAKDLEGGHIKGQRHHDNEFGGAWLDDTSEALAAYLTKYRDRFRVAGKYRKISQPEAAR